MQLASLVFMNKIRILFVTNPYNSDPEEDIYLAKYLSEFFEIIVADPKEACRSIKNFSYCFVRNAWPSHELEKELNALQQLSKSYNVKLYNPVHRLGYVEDKNYLATLWADKYPVIPTITALKNIKLLEKTDMYIVKPIDGCSSWGVKELSRTELLNISLEKHIIQPKMNFKDEISFYFIDDNLMYCMVSAGPNQRWELKEYAPSATEVDWAKKFITWNKLPYGIQRIDACRMSDGKLYLMEIEDTLAMLSLDTLSEATRNYFCQELVNSLSKNFK